MSSSAAQLVAHARERIEQVTPEVAFSEASEGAVLLDIREPVEWERHIAGAVQVPRGLLEWAADPSSSRHVEGLEPDRRVLVYCRSGTRASLAVVTLETLGYTDVANVEGGIAAWTEAGLPVVEHHEGV